jgi:hypothetical protein
VIRVLRTGDPRLWVAIGLVVGIGLEAKETILLLVGGLALGLVLTGRIRQTTSDDHRLTLRPEPLGAIFAAKLRRQGLR